jgi:hypothetical protein
MRNAFRGGSKIERKATNEKESFEAQNKRGQEKEGCASAEDHCK